MPVGRVPGGRLLSYVAGTERRRRRVGLLLVRWRRIATGVGGQLRLAEPRGRLVARVMRWVRRGEYVPGQGETVLSQGVAEERLRIGLGRSVGALHSSSPSVVAVLEHVVERRVERPVVALAFAATLSRHLLEALVEAQVVPDGVLPPFLVPLEVRELGGDVRVDFGQGRLLRRRGVDGHGDEGDVRVRRFALAVAGAVGGRRGGRGGRLRLGRLTGAGAGRPVLLLRLDRCVRRVAAPVSQQRAGGAAAQTVEARHRRNRCNNNKKQ